MKLVTQTIMKTKQHLLYTDIGGIDGHHMITTKVN